MQAVVIDFPGVYKDSRFPRVESLGALVSHIEKLTAE